MLLFQRNWLLNYSAIEIDAHVAAHFVLSLDASNFFHDFSLIMLIT